MRALITGAAGQDGSYLSELLLSKGYEVHGLIRPSGNPKTVVPGVETHFFDIQDSLILHELMRKIKPDEVYNLAAMSNVGASFKSPLTTFQVDAIGAMNVMDAAISVGAKFVQASTSEMYGNAQPGMFLNEQSSMLPASPYAVAKLAAHHAVRIARESRSAFACSAIMFNHESPRRGSYFVTQAACRQIAAIAKGEERPVVLGNLEARRDWSHARDVVRGMWMMLQQDKPDDFVFASGVDRGVLDWVNACLKVVSLKSVRLESDPNKLRPNDVHCLRGDHTKAEKILGWKAESTFEQLVDEMMAAAL